MGCENILCDCGHTALQHQNSSGCMGYPLKDKYKNPNGSRICSCSLNSYRVIDEKIKELEKEILYWKKKSLLCSKKESLWEKIETIVLSFEELDAKARCIAVDRILDFLRKMFIYYVIERGEAPSVIFKNGEFVSDIEVVYCKFYQYLEDMECFSFSFFDEESTEKFNNVAMEYAYDLIVDICNRYEYTIDGDVYTLWV